MQVLVSKEWCQRWCSSATRTRKKKSYCRYSLLIQINSIWEITHFCKITQGMEFTTGHLNSGQNRVLLRHFNSGRIFAVSPNNLPYLQDVKELKAGREEASKLLASPHPIRESILERSHRSHVSQSRSDMHEGFAGIQTERSGVQGFSAGASRSRSGSSGGSERSHHDADDDEGKHDEDLFDFKVDESFIDEKPPDDDQPIKDDFSVKVPEQKNEANIARSKSNEITFPQIEEPSLQPNDPPIIKKTPLGKISSVVKKPLNKRPVKPIEEIVPQIIPPVPTVQPNDDSNMMGDTSMQNLPHTSINEGIRKAPGGASDRTLLAPSIESKDIASVNKLHTLFQREGATIKMQRGVSKIIDPRSLNNISMNMVRGGGDQGTGIFGTMKLLDINNILPHKEALRDLKHAIHFTQFQGTEISTVSDGESFKIMKHNLNSDEPSHIYLDVLDSQFDYGSIKMHHEEEKKHPQFGAQLNKFFKPIDGAQKDDTYLVKDC